MPASTSGIRVGVTVEQSWHVVPGGIAVATVELLRELTARDGLDLVGVAAWHRRQPAAGLVPPVPIRRFPLPRLVLYESWQWLRTPSVERATGRVDVVHDAGYVVPPSKAPLVTTVHDLAFLAYPHHYTWHSRRVLLRGLELTRRHARLVMCPSLATKAACEAAGIGAERLRVVPLGVRLQTPQPEFNERVRRRYRLERPFVLFVGTVEPRKNLHRVIEAFRELDAAETELILVGPKGWREDVDVALDGLRGRARTLGYLPRDELDVLYAQAAAVVYPSLAEGFGLPVLEAMANGAAVVTSAGRGRRARGDRAGPPRGGGGRGTRGRRRPVLLHPPILGCPW